LILFSDQTYIPPKRTVARIMELFENW
jgi:hypothetical protein